MAVTTTELTSGWQFRQTDANSDEQWLPVRRMPTVIHLDLQDNGKIPDPFIDMNELAVRWVAEKSWTYRTTFPTASTTLKDARTDLVFKGLDTFATVRLNGHKILETDNMFLEYRVDVTSKLQHHGNQDSSNKENVLEIVFDSALLRGEELVKQHAHEHNFIAHQTENSRLPVRKCQCHWGWDWGPILITAGPWKPILLETYVERIDDIWFQADVGQDLRRVTGKLFASVELSKKDTASGIEVRFELSLDDEVVFSSAEVKPNEQGVASTDFHVEMPSLWYPSGYGKQPLYRLTAKILSPTSTNSASPRISRSKSIGFRKCELIQEPDEYGKSFFFRINNVDIFAGGSCWIPADSFIPRIREQGYRKWMELMIEGNQIMTRVWGGGIYEDDAFYTACDELGILVWQDFAFACASYPTYPSFLSQIQSEATQAIRRLRTHPSLTIFAGNNEDYEIQEQEGLEYDYEGDKDPEHWLKTTFPARYIYEYLLPKVVGEEMPGMVYHPSSPWGDGKKTWDGTVGDKHQWKIWHGPMNAYQSLSTPSSGLSGRFISEFGMESFPHLPTITSHIATHPSQQYPGSMTMDHHNRADQHVRRLMTYLSENFRVNTCSTLAQFAHLSQVMQSDTISFAYRSWRREWGSQGKRKCGGVLVWQMNDTWPTMSWAVVDYFRVKKPAFYAIKRHLRPVVVGLSRPFHEWTSGHVDRTIAVRDGRYDLWVSNLGTKDVEVDVEVRVVSIKSGNDLCHVIKHWNVMAKANGTTEIENGAKVPIDLSHDVRKPFDPTKDYDPFVIHATLSINDKIIGTDTSWPHPLKYLDFTNRNVKVTLSPEKDRLTVTAEKPIHGLVIQEKKDWVMLSDNGFDVVPGQEVVVEVSRGAVEGRDLRWSFIGAERGEMGSQDGGM